MTAMKFHVKQLSVRDSPSVEPQNVYRSYSITADLVPYGSLQSELARFYDSRILRLHPE